MEKRRTALGQDFFCVICNWAVWNFDLCYSRRSVISALSVPEHCLSFYFVCDNQIQISCAVWLHKMENLAMTYCYLWLTEKLWLLGGTAPKRPPLKHLLHYYQSLLTTQPAVGCWLGKKVRTLIDYLLTNGLNCLTVKDLAGWHLGKRAAVLKLISFPVYLGCYALHYGIMYVSTVYTGCVLVFAFAFLSCKKKIFFKQDFLHWIIQKLAKIGQHFKE